MLSRFVLGWKFFFPESVKHSFVFIFNYFCFVFIFYYFLYCHYFISSPFPMLSPSLGLAWNLAFVPDSTPPPALPHGASQVTRVTEPRGLESSRLFKFVPCTFPLRLCSDQFCLQAPLPYASSTPKTTCLCHPRMGSTLSVCPLPRHHRDLKTLDPFPPTSSPFQLDLAIISFFFFFFK